jgi:cellulose synthase/poly-beta-1,6-N-acetylglucosamine synthase-like glycosyltransferase/peptidoglycan/xylan/chitin deacetylase (PgdA/CDA1 family)/spore germination protein YaaH
VNLPWPPDRLSPSGVSIFFDETGRRRRAWAGAFFLLTGGAAIAAFALALSILSVPPRALPGTALDFPPLSPASPARSGSPPGPGADRGFPTASGGRPSPTLRVAFHVPWDEASLRSLRRNVGSIDWLVAGWLSVNGPDPKLTILADPQGERILAGAGRRPKLLVMLQNASAGKFDGGGAAALLRDPAKRNLLLDRLDAFLLQKGAGGIVFDFENLPHSAQDDYPALLAEAKRRFQARGWVTTVAVPVNDPDWNLVRYASVADKLFLMAYDEHQQTSGPGPVASDAWFAASLTRALRGLPRDKVVIALGSYGYDWPRGGRAAPLSVEQAWQRAHEARTAPSFDRASGNSTYAYLEAGKRHDIWLLDAASFANQMLELHRRGWDQLALWRLGSEDPSVWALFPHQGGRIPAAAMEDLPAGSGVDLEGSGEVLRLDSVPAAGRRSFRLDPRGRVVDERFSALPLSYAVTRGGYRPGLVALTFDDGPDDEWTGRLLTILKAHKVPATFFIVGEKAVARRALLQLMITEGHEIGNHSYTHPRMVSAGQRSVAIQINATQRLFQAYTGRSLTLFRPPYFSDAEPSTEGEMEPIREAQRLGYLSVGLHVDPHDWQRPGTAAIVERTVRGVEASSAAGTRQIVLLHDSGGDRSQTAAALPLIIERLRARGYRFVRVSELIGLQREEAMPRVAGSDRFAAAVDLFLFTAVAAAQTSIGSLFAAAVVLAIVRLTVLLILAAFQNGRRPSRAGFDSPRPRVSVLIPAFNEAAVIGHCLASVLGSREAAFEVIVIDDGSTDGTGEVVSRHHAADPRVRLVTQSKGGKAAALNRGLEQASGDVLVALDADTELDPAAIDRLARCFLDGAVGAVAGNAKVRNPTTLIARLQALEYLASQSVERRAMEALQAIQVVPGAVGAWRRAAVQGCGGFPGDTVAEDQDLTIALRRAGWRIVYEPLAVGWTEVPETVAALSRQRLRWAFGTLQCLWKHRSLLRGGRPPGLALVAFPQAILTQVGLTILSPLLDLALILSAAAVAAGWSSFGPAYAAPGAALLLRYLLTLMVVDLVFVLAAAALDGERRPDLLPILLQRLGYRQILYIASGRALARALSGGWMAWGRADRRGSGAGKPARLRLAPR